MPLMQGHKFQMENKGIRPRQRMKWTLQASTYHTCWADGGVLVRLVRAVRVTIASPPNVNASSLVEALPLIARVAAARHDGRILGSRAWNVCLFQGRVGLKACSFTHAGARVPIYKTSVLCNHDRSDQKGEKSCCQTKVWVPSRINVDNALLYIHCGWRTAINVYRALPKLNPF